MNHIFKMLILIYFLLNIKLLVSLLPMQSAIVTLFFVGESFSLFDSFFPLFNYSKIYILELPQQNFHHLRPQTNGLATSG